jgi:hypothetical protein
MAQILERTFAEQAWGPEFKPLYQKKGKKKKNLDINFKISKKD